MNKLQLYITKSTKSFKSLINFNPAEDVTRHVTDVREALSAVDYDAAEKNIFYLLRYEDEGVMVVVLRTIPDRPLDHLAAWIYVPNGIQISGAELEEVVRTTTRKVSAPGVSETDVADLRRLFSKEYPVDREAASMVAMHGSEYAFAIYGAGYRPLGDFLGGRRFQPAFTGYKGVILIEDGLGVSGRAVDVTSEQLAEIVPLLPPEVVPGGFTPYIYDRPFNRPYKVALGSDIAVSWQRAGFDPQEQIVSVSAPGLRPEAPLTDESRKIITPASFLVTSQFTREPVSGCTIKVNGTEITGEHSFTQNELSQAHVWISAEGFFPYSARMDLASVTQALVQMQERSKVYRFELPLNTSDFGGPIEFEVRTKKELTGSPIDGYEVLDTLQEGTSRTNHLGYKGTTGATPWHKAVFTAIGLAAGIIIMLFINRCGSASTVDDASTGSDISAIAPAHDTPEVNTPASTPKPVEKVDPPVKVTPESPSDITPALTYLDSTKKWDRDRMEEFPLLRGLWDDMNNYNLIAIRDNWSKSLSGSSNFKSVMAAARQSLHKKVKLDRNPAHTPTFNKASDHVIGIVGWTYYIDP